MTAMDQLKLEKLIREFDKCKKDMSVSMQTLSKQTTANTMRIQVLEARVDSLAALAQGINQ